MESLLNCQTELSSRVLKAYTNFKKSPKERITNEYCQSRLEAIEEIWTDFRKGHSQLVKISKPDELKTTLYISTDVYNITEESYIDYKCALKTALTTFKSQENPTESDQLRQSTSACRDTQLCIGLPKIIIPSFSGQYTEWITFRDLFLSMIQNNKSLDKVQKLQYLKGYLTGEAEQLLRHIPVSHDNYDKCWSLLEARYNNKKYLSHWILKRLLSQKNATCESASYLKELIDTTTDCLNALSNLGIKTDTWDIIVIHILSLKLDNESRKQWELYVTNSTSSDELPTFEQFQQFITNRFRALEFIEPKSINRGHSSYTNVNKPRVLHVVQTPCPFCSEDHKLHICKKIIEENTDTRRNFVQENGLCFNCLGNNHSAKFCQNPTKCRICKRHHHSLLHPKGEGKGTPKVHSAIVENENSEDSEEDTTENGISVCTAAVRNNSVLLATALVKTEARSGELYTLRALIDQGSQACFITEAAVQLLKLKRIPIRGVISGLGGGENVTSNSIVKISIKSIIQPSVEIIVKAHVMKSITAALPSRKVVEVEWLNLNEIQLADPQYHTPNKIDLLLGAEIYGKILQDGLRKDPNGLLVAQSTSLGWIISGLVKTSNSISTSVVVMHTVLEENDRLKKFWEMENEPSEKQTIILTNEEKRCEDFFESTTRKASDGRFIVKLPFKQEDPACKKGHSRQIAMKRFLTLEKKLQKNESLKEEYKKTFDEYLQLRHMVPVLKKHEKSAEAVYLPYHAVIREDKETTKVRIVFDASCKGTNGISLNDDLMVGPTLQLDLRHIVMRWRNHPITLVADIAKMYRQIIVDDEDANFQRILWREDPEQDIEEYKLLRVTFGTSSAPYLAVKCLMQIALDGGAEYPCAAERILKDFYMDDLLTGCQTVEEGFMIYTEMNNLLSKAGFQLQKWSSNSDDLLKVLKQKLKDDEGSKELKIKTDSIIKILGLTWNRSDDTFQYTVTLPKMEEPITKRKIISDIARLYDPLGWVAPSIILAKILIQKLWLAGIGWDEAVPNKILNEWVTYRMELPLLTNMNLPRWLGLRKNDHVELHGFSDASKIAFAAVIYVRVVDSERKIRVSLMTAKTKVAPIKQVSLPRLELCGAVLLSKLLAEGAQVMGVHKANLHAWTDSTIVLAWINSHPSRWKTFVANRVSTILDFLDPQQWSHIPSKQNPADCASRGLRPSDLAKNQIWQSGPKILTQNIIEYNKGNDLTTEVEEAKVYHIVAEESIWNRFSSLTRLIRVVAYCRRFLNMIKPKTLRHKSKILEHQEIKDALDNCIKQCQRESFEEEMNALQGKESLKKNSKLVSLNPYIDQNNILRVGGRLELSQLNEARKHPILIPKQGHFTALLVSDAHKKTLHGGPQLMLRYLHSKYWILGAKEIVKKQTRKCTTCIRFAGQQGQQLMGQLPSPRATPGRAFKKSGVDYAGPVWIRTSKGRGHHAHKGYICLFICMATRAVHIEAVTDLTSQGFLAAFRRFVARRGHCSYLWSDNGTNFVGASRELKRLFELEKSSIMAEIAETLATNGTSWHFIPPYAPNFGGLWEAAIKSTKYHLKRVIGETTLTYEELSTVLSQVEACLNSRPLSRIDSISDEFTMLTPGHFLVGEPLVIAPDRNFESSNITNLRRWQLTQRMLQDFWRRWSHDYLVKFQQRYKWSRRNAEPKEGDIVIIKEDDIPPNRWLLGKVVARHAGSDGIVRVVTLRTKDTIIKRCISKLCVLPVTE